MGTDLRRLFLEKVSLIRQEDWYGLLGVPTDADMLVIRRAYFALFEQLDPARVGQPDLRTMAEEVRGGLRKAFGTLHHAGERRRYEQRREMGGSFNQQKRRSRIESSEAEAEMEALVTAPPASMAGQEVKVAKVLADRAGWLERQGRHSDAERYLERSRELDPETHTYAVRLGWAALNNPDHPGDSRLARAKKLLESAAAKMPYDAGARYALARYWQEAGNPVYFKNELEAALRADPGHEGAADALSKLRASERSQTKKPSGFFGKLFGRG